MITSPSPSVRGRLWLGCVLFFAEHKPVTTPEIIESGDVVIDLLRHTLNVTGQSIDLTLTEFDLLVVMASQPGRAFSRMQLLESTQGEAYEGYERTVDAHIKNLRAKIEVDPKKPQYIETVFGVGYRFRDE